MPVPYSLAIAELRSRLLSGRLTPHEVAHDVLGALAEGDPHHVWIYRLPQAQVLAQARRLEADGKKQSLPLYGVPFAIKDNMDAAGYPTTAACPAYSHTAMRTATAVQRLLDAGAILIGKTNLDQFATGLVGTRSPYGACTNAFNADYIAGGSSSGSALAVALNLVSFALGTDTAGSGRVPAGFNNIVGLKPSRGVISTSGVVPACRTLDCVSVFAFTVDDAWSVYEVARGWDAADPYSRRTPVVRQPFSGTYRCGIPRVSQLEFYGDAQAERMFRQGITQIERSGGRVVEIDYAPLSEIAALLYQGPWLAERMAGIRAFFTDHADAMHPVTREITARGAGYSAVDAFEAAYRLQELSRQTEAMWQEIDVLAVPTSPTIYTLAQVEADPVSLNSRLGYYTNFVNLLDMAAIAVPAGIRADGLPAGITLIAPAFSEPLLCSLGDRLHRLAGVSLGATSFPIPEKATDVRTPAAATQVTVAVVGAHLSGMPLNYQLVERDSRLLGAARTTAQYRLYALPGTTPAKPGLVRCAADTGCEIEIELWEMPVANFGSFVALISAPLCIGTLALADGRTAQGFLCEAHVLKGARDISEFGGWRAFLASGQR